jgi:hypothetical protein
MTSLKSLKYDKIKISYLLNMFIVLFSYLLSLSLISYLFLLNLNFTATALLNITKAFVILDTSF